MLSIKHHVLSDLKTKSPDFCIYVVLIFDSTESYDRNIVSTNLEEAEKIFLHLFAVFQCIPSRDRVLLPNRNWRWAERKCL